MTTDTSERGLEILICRALRGSDCAPRPAGTPALVAETTANLPDETEEPEVLDEAEGSAEDGVDEKGLDHDAVPKEVKT